MADLLPHGPLLIAFLAASFVLAVTPGPAVLYIVTRTLAQGRRSGLASVGGVALGNLGNAIGASVGLAALFAVSSVAFAVVKYAGALYLIYLGVQAMRAPVERSARARQESLPVGRIFRDGFMVALFNPKTAIFFAAFLPQFMHDAAASLPRSIALGAVFVAMAAVTDTMYSLTASAIAPALTKTTALRGASRYLSGGVFIGLGLLTAFGGPRTTK